jgi:hypothetical protein
LAGNANELRTMQKRSLRTHRSCERCKNGRRALIAVANDAKTVAAHSSQSRIMGSGQIQSQDSGV